MAFWMLLAGAALLLGFVGLAVAHAVHYDAAVLRVAASMPGTNPDEVSSERTGNLLATLFVGVPALLVAVWLAVVARPVLRGSNVARIFAFVAGGGLLAVFMTQVCGGGSDAASLAFAISGDGSYDGSSEDSGFYTALYDETETFDDLFFLGSGFIVLMVLAVSAAAVLLLAVPPANRYFVPRPAPAWPAYAAFPGGPPIPYVICPDPSAHFQPAAPAAPAAPSDPPPPDTEV